MERLIFVVGLFVLASCAIIPETDQDPKEFHECLVSYLRSINISSSLSLSESNEDSDACQTTQTAISETINGVYNQVERNLYNVLANQSEVECFVETLREQRFLEVNIVLTAAHLTMNGSLEEVYRKSKSIFVFAATKCVITPEMVMEIIKDLSERLRVSDDEFDCIKLYLTDGRRGKRSVDAETKEEEIEDTTIAAEDKFSTFLDLSYDETTTMEAENGSEMTSGGITKLEAGNAIVKNNSSLEISSENETTKPTNDDKCSSLLLNVRERIANYQYSLLSDEENRCMSNKTSESDINNIFRFIVLRQSNLNDLQINERNEIVKTKISNIIWNVIDCSDIFGFKDIVDMLSKHNSI